jgi:hypothetical protein
VPEVGTLTPFAALGLGFGSSLPPQELPDGGFPTARLGTQVDETPLAALPPALSSLAAKAVLPSMAQQSAAVPLGVVAVSTAG